MYYKCTLACHGSNDFSLEHSINFMSGCHYGFTLNVKSEQYISVMVLMIWKNIVQMTTGVFVQLVEHLIHVPEAGVLVL